MKPQIVKSEKDIEPDLDTVERDEAKAIMADPDQHQSLVEQLLANMQSPPVMVATSLLDGNPVQPVDRTTNVDQLVADIVHTKRIDPILVVRRKGTKRYTIINGHRRTKAAGELNLSEINAYVITSDEPAPLLWMRFNESAKAIKAVDYFWAWGKESPGERDTLLRHIPGGTRRQIRLIVEIFGLSDAVSIAVRQATPDLDISRRISPHFVTWIPTTNALIIARSLEPLNLKQIGYWLMKHSMTSMIRVIGAMKKDVTTTKRVVKRLRTAIEKDTPFRLKNK